MISEEGGKIAFCKESVYDVSYQQHIKDGATVVKLALEHNGGVEFTINDKLEFTSIKVNKDFLAGSKGEGSLIVTIDEINKMAEEVIKVMGGEVKQF
jgi:DNA recombination-dependent growth factor C